MQQTPPPKGRNDGHQFDHNRITDHIFIGSDLCKGGVCKIHSIEFAKLGVNVELNLSHENNELPPQNVETYVWLPTVDGNAPTDVVLDMGTALMHEAIGHGKTVYVHCRNGHGRSPTLVAAYFIRFNRKTAEAAMQEIVNNRQEAHFEETQKQALESYERKWST